MFLTLSFFWFIRTVRITLFYIYLWQLKEYHIGRFLDHFNTYKGKRLFLNPLKFLKIALILGYFLFPIFFPLILGFFYAGETLLFCRDIFKKTFKRPFLTKKTALISFLAIALAILAPILLYLYQKSLVRFSLYLLLIDIFFPILISVFILFFQPLAVLARWRIIKKAKQKREKFSARGGSASGRKNLLVIGITGSYGKTSTKEFLYTILSEKFGKDKVLKTKEHQNSEIGIAQCILNDLKPEHEIFIVEMGAYGRGGIKLLCDIAKPKIGILTGINEQHMATSGSQENIVKTKFELIESLPEDGVAVMNLDNDFIKSNIKYQKSKIQIKNQKFYSIKEKTDIWAEDIKVEKDFITFRALSRDGDFAEFKVNLLGAHNILNILGAAAVAKELGMTLQEIAKTCVEIKLQQTGMVPKRGINGLNIIDATYSANPDGVISHLEYLKIWQGRKVIVMPCLIELGKASKEVHRRIGKKIAEACDLAIITTKDRFKEIREAASVKAPASRGAEILFIKDPKEIFEKIKSFCLSSEALAKEEKDECTVLLESRVPSQLIKQLTINN